MKKAKISAWIVGGAFAVTIILGALLLIPSKVWSVTVAVVVICFSIVSGMLIPNPVSFLMLFAGICIIILPAWCVGVVLIGVGVIGAVTNLIVAPRQLKTSE